MSWFLIFCSFESPVIFYIQYTSVKIILLALNTCTKTDKIYENWLTEAKVGVTEKPLIIRDNCRSMQQPAEELPNLTVNHSSSP